MKLRIISAVSFAFLLLAAWACQPTTTNQPDQLKAAHESITANDLMAHTKELSSDRYEGRGPGTPGEELTVKYLTEQFQKLGLKPGNPDGTFVQKVPLAGFTGQPTASFTAGGKTINLEFPKDYVAVSRRLVPESKVENSDMVFVGYGVVAPEYGWDDYKGLDVKGKTIVMLINDPAVPDANDPKQLDDKMFKGRAMTYYGRWTYKYEEAARQGAKGCFVIHNTIPAAYPFAVVQNNWNAPHLYLDLRGKDVFYSEGVGWISKPATEKIFAAAGLDFNDQQSKARQRGFKGQNLKLKISTAMNVKSRFDTSYNVIGKITGSERPEEYIIYTAHWDHLGIGKKDAAGDSIYNGALDNASGTAGLLEIAKAFKSMKNKPARTLVFLAVTAEEQGLWGSAYYAENPVYPKEKTVANINMDGINPYGKMNDIIIVGKGQSDLEDYLSEEAAKVNRSVTADGEPEKGYYFRSDHFNFAKIGIPALYTHTGNDFEGKGKDYGQQLKNIYVQKYYHQPSDEYDTTRLNFEGGVEDLKLLFQVGKRLAFTDAWPQWKETSEFKAARKTQ